MAALASSAGEGSDVAAGGYAEKGANSAAPGGSRAGTLLWELFDPRESLRALRPRCREEGDGSRLAALDGMRCLAMLWVLLYHCICHMYAIPNHLVPGVGNFFVFYQAMDLASWQVVFAGIYGVDVFFVLSGLLITRGYLRCDMAADNTAEPPRGRLDVAVAFAQRYVLFLVRRFLRLWPLMALAIAIRFIMTSRDVPGADRESLSEWAWAYLMLIPNLFPNQEGAEKAEYLFHLWSIGIEWQMYVLTPFICEAVYNRSTGTSRPGAFWVLALLSAASMGLRAFWVYGPADMGNELSLNAWPADALYLNPLARISPYLSGIAACLALEGRPLARVPDASKPWAARAQSWWVARVPSWVVPVGNILLDLAAMAGVLAAVQFGGMPAVRRIVVVLPPVFGWSVARCIYRTVTAEPVADGTSLWRQCRPWRLVRIFLSLGAWRGIALISYAAYMVQFFALIPAKKLALALDFGWEDLDTSVMSTTKWRFVGGYLAFVAVSLLFALPCHFLVESPGMRLGKLAQGALRRRLVRPAGAAEAAPGDVAVV